MLKISEEVEQQSNLLAVESMKETAAKYDLDGEVITPVSVVPTIWAPDPFPKYFVSGMVRIKTWFGGRTILAAEFFPSPTNDVDKRMKQYQAEQTAPGYDQ